MGIRVPSNTRHASLVTTYTEAMESRTNEVVEQPRPEYERQVVPQQQWRQRRQNYNCPGRHVTRLRVDD